MFNLIDMIICFLLGFLSCLFLPDVIKWIFSNFTVLCIMDLSLTDKAISNLKNYQTLGFKIVYLTRQDECCRIHISEILNTNDLKGKLHTCEKVSDFDTNITKIKIIYNTCITTRGWE